MRKCRDLLRENTYFQFDGSGLLPGTYFYRITNSSDFYTGKFIKSR